MSPYELLIVALLLAVLAYHEWWWRDRLRTEIELWKARLMDAEKARTDMENGYEARLAQAAKVQQDLEGRLRDADNARGESEERHSARLTEVADREFERGLVAGGGLVESYEFTRQAERKVLFFKTAQKVSLMLVLYRGKVIRAHGDLSNVELFELPEEIKNAIAAARHVGDVFGAAPRLPKLAA